MTVKELIETLQDYDPEAEVALAYNYGDYPQTVVAEPVENADVLRVTYSSYHKMDRLLNDEEEQDDDIYNESRERVILTGRGH